MKKIIVLGGGTAGWLTSLMVREFYPDFDITLIESAEIGILGAGEGTVPHFVELLDFLRIPVSALVKECNATIKIGIKFSNWNGDGTSYFHDFIAGDELEEWIFDDSFRYNMLTSYLVGKGVHLDSINFYAKLAEQWKVPFILNDKNLSNHVDAIQALELLGNFALHFDARKLANFLGNVGRKYRRINYIEGKYTNALTDDQGFVTGVQLESGQQVECDFLFDCSGFARLLLEKHFNEKWIDYKHYLPLDKAIPFFLPHDGKDFPPYTEAIAMKYGWMWKIPVQDRYGCGYVFDSSYIDEEEAQQEVEQMLGHEIEVPRSLPFQPGSFENVLVKNCYGVGLSHHFVEPLEATSIWTFSKNLINFLRSDAINHLTPEVTDFVNKHSREVISTIPEFLYLHYLTERNDTPFWQEFRSKTTMMESLKRKQEIWQVMPLFDADTVQLQMFTAPSWISVGDGVRYFNREAFRNLSSHWDQQRLERGATFLKNRHEKVRQSCMLHGDFLSFLSQKSQPIPKG
jgi:tryptophan halogenase